VSRTTITLMLFALFLSLSGTSGPTAASSPANVSPLASASSLVIPAQGGCFTAALSGASETPPNDATAEGFGTFVLSPDRTSLVYEIHYAPLSSDETGAHIHLGAPGVAGGVVFPLPADSPKQGTLTLADEDLANLLAGLLYVNIHSENFPDGEIRGQIVKGGGCFAANLSGDQETPPVTTAASGTGIFALAPDMSVLVYHISYSGLGSAEVGAHIHRGARDVPGPIVFDLGEPGSPKHGAWDLAPTDIDDLLAGLLYVNIHTSNYPGGEIRGQIEVPGSCFVAELTGASETPPNDVTTTGRGTFVFSADDSTLHYDITYTELTSAETGAHIHQEAPGAAGGIVFDLGEPGSPKRGMWGMNQDHVDALLAGLLYVNIHSTNYPGGEIRGQIVPGACTLHLPIIARD
jgi:Cu/Zn superoxide dismutase